MSGEILPARATRLGFILLVAALAGCSRTTLTSEPLATETALPSQPAPVPTDTPQLPGTSTPASGGNEVLFDDFSYADQAAMIANGWVIRNRAGWPGVPGASWSQENVSFVDDPDQIGNRLLLMRSSTDGTNEGTSQTQFCHQRKYLEGTYASRVKFSDGPAVGPDGDQINETFYLTSGLNAPMDPDYSEIDNEYLPNGGWGGPPQALYVTTWETCQLDPWVADNASDMIQGSMAGWHTLVMQVTNGTVRYYVDGELIAFHGGERFPEVPMSINFNLWFIDGGLLSPGETRQYDEYVDWVYFEGDTALTPDEVLASVVAMREAGLAFQDTVPASSPALPSLCDF